MNSPFSSRAVPSPVPTGANAHRLIAAPHPDISRRALTHVQISRRALAPVPCGGAV